jgi:hypothetical protein
VDSNIRIWGEHETRRNAAEAAHDVHRHDQITRTVLPPSAGGKLQVSRQCVSGVASPDSCFLEAWGFDLGLRDRQANPATLWMPPGGTEMFRAERSFSRNNARMAESFRTLRKSASVPTTGEMTKQPSMITMLKPEDIGGEAGDHASPEDTQLGLMGKPFGSRSCRYWDRYDHAAHREAAKMACAVHSPSFKAHPHAHPIKENLELQPASIYSRKFRQSGEDSLRRHTTATEKAGRKTERAKAGRTLRLDTTL